MKLKAELFREVLQHHGEKSVRVPETVTVDIEFPDHVTEYSPGFFKDHTNGIWQIVKVGIDKP